MGVWSVWFEILGSAMTASYLTKEKAVELASLFEIGGRGQSHSKQKKAIKSPAQKINHRDVDEMRVVCFPGNCVLVAACSR